MGFRLTHLVALLLAPFALETTARADSWLAPATGGQRPFTSSAVASEELARWTDPVLDSFSSRCGGSTAVLSPEARPTTSAAQTADGTVWTIGAAPASKGGSGQVFFSALLAAGCFQLARHRHDLKLTALPQWYHENAPLQIRHVVRYDFHPSVPAVCFFEQVRDQDAGTWQVVRDSWPCCEGATFLSSRSVRGPPSLS